MDQQSTQIGKHLKRRPTALRPTVSCAAMLGEPRKTLLFQRLPLTSSADPKMRYGVASAPTGRRSRGFTLIEIIVVITIMAIMAALIVPRVVGRTDDARVAAARQDIATLMNALKLYRLDNGRYPTSEQGLRALVEKPSADPIPQNWKTGGYLDAPSVRKDPWNNDYQYLNPGLHGEIDVLSFGRDGQPGGEGPDADIGSWSQ
jgi:general secretion pathway protein G